LLTENYLPKDYQTELVLRKSTYNNKFNRPYDKRGYDPKKVLADNDPYLNLFLKVTLNNNNFYYVHLATMPAVKTTHTFFDKNVGIGNKSGAAYETFLKEGTEEIPIDPKLLEVKTGTRTIKLGTNNTLGDLKSIKGLKFYNGTIFTNEPRVFLFPSLDIGKETQNFEAFSEL